MVAKSFWQVTSLFPETVSITSLAYFREISLILSSWVSLPFNVQACKSHSETSPGDDAAQHTDTCTVTAYVSLGDVSTPTLTEAAPVATQHEGGLDCVLEGMHLPLTEHRLRGPKRAGACDRGGAT